MQVIQMKVPSNFLDLKNIFSIKIVLKPQWREMVLEEIRMSVFDILHSKKSRTGWNLKQKYRTILKIKKIRDEKFLVKIKWLIPNN